MNKDVRISVVVPVYNEAGNITPLHNELNEVLSDISSEYEILYVNDASTDNSLTELESLTGATIINQNRNYGQATALDAGFRAAQYELVVSLDGDGQNDPQDISRLLEKLEQDNLDVVAGWRKMREDRGGIKILTRIGRALRRLLLKDPVHDTGCTLRVYKAEAAKSLDLKQPTPLRDTSPILMT